MLHMVHGVCFHGMLLSVTDYAVYQTCYQSALRAALQRQCGYNYYAQCRLSIYTLFSFHTPRSWEKC